MAVLLPAFEMQDAGFFKKGVITCGPHKIAKMYIRAYMYLRSVKKG